MTTKGNPEVLAARAALAEEIAKLQSEADRLDDLRAAAHAQRREALVRARAATAELDTVLGRIAVLRRRAAPAAA